jgi:hypothetical protein
VVPLAAECEEIMLHSGDPRLSVIIYKRICSASQTAYRVNKEGGSLQLNKERLSHPKGDCYAATNFFILFFSFL